MEENVSRADEGKKAGLVGICINIILFAIKLFAGLLAGSVSIVADAVNNLTDAGSSVLIMVGYIVASKPADREHPYGHARFEYLSSLFISVIVTVLGVELLKSSVDSLLHAEEAADYGILSIVIMCSAIVGKIILALFYLSVSKKIGSESLKASAMDSIGDVCSTAAVILGIILTPVIGPKADGIFGTVIAVYILVMGIKLIRDSSDTIIGRAPDAEFVHTIAKKIKSYDGVLGIHDLVLHSYGFDKYFATVHVEVDASKDIMMSHDIMDNIEDDFRNGMGIQLVVHMDPITVDNAVINNLRLQVGDIIQETAAEYAHPISTHDFRVVFGVSHTNLIFDIAISDDFPAQSSELVESIREDIKNKIGAEYHAVITVDRDYTTESF